MTDLSLARHIGAILARASADVDPLETREWIEALDALIGARRRERATSCCAGCCSTRAGARAAAAVLATPYVNTIALEQQPPYPGDLAIEERLTAIDALERARDGGARQPRRLGELGGHIASYASAAEIFEVGFNHFFRGRATAAATSSTSSRTRRPASTRAPSSKAG